MHYILEKFTFNKINGSDIYKKIDTIHFNEDFNLNSFKLEHYILESKINVKGREIIDKLLIELNDLKDFSTIIGCNRTMKILDQIDILKCIKYRNNFFIIENVYYDLFKQEDDNTKYYMIYYKKSEIFDMLILH